MEWLLRSKAEQATMAIFTVAFLNWECTCTEIFTSWLRGRGRGGGRGDAGWEGGCGGGGGKSDWREVDDIEGGGVLCVCTGVLYNYSYRFTVKRTTTEKN